MDFENILNFERRTGVKESEIDEFTRKAADVQAAIQAMMEGKLSPEDVKIEGIETEEERKKREEEQKIRLEIARRKERELQVQRKKEEHDRWWSGAELFASNRGVNAGDDDQEADDADPVSRRMQRYTADYSRWDQWIPSDPASKEELSAKQAEEERQRNELFEKNNPEFCREYVQDMKERQKSIEKKKESADILRLKGNRYFGAKNFEKARELYFQALKSAPYDVKTLTNIAQVDIKENKFEDALEFLTRTLYLDPTHVKALSRKAHVLAELGQAKEALELVVKALKIDPKNDDLKTQMKDLGSTLEEIESERLVSAITKVDVSASTDCTASSSAPFSPERKNRPSYSPESPSSSSKQRLIGNESNDIEARSRALHLSVASMQDEAGQLFDESKRQNASNEMLRTRRSILALDEAIQYLATDKLLRTYLRTSKLLERSVIPVMKSSLSWISSCGVNSCSAAVTSFAEQSLRLLDSATMHEKSSKQLLLQSDLMPLMKAIFLSPDVIRHTSLLNAFAEFLLHSVEDDSCHSFCQSVLRDKEIFDHFLSLMVNLSTEDNSIQLKSEKQLPKLLCSIAKMLSLMLKGGQSNSGGPLMGALSVTMQFLLVAYENCPKGEQSLEYFEIFLDILLPLSQVEALRGYFAVRYPRLNESEYSLASVLVCLVKICPELRVNILAVLLNACLDGDCTVRQAVFEAGGLETAIEVLKSEQEAQLKQLETLATLKRASTVTSFQFDYSDRCRCAGLLSRLAGLSEVSQMFSRSPELYGLLCRELRLCSSNLLLRFGQQVPVSSCPDLEDGKWVSEETSHLVRALASITDVSDASREAAAKEHLVECLLELFPRPREELGVITPTSVCQHPAVLASPVLLGNAARCLLPYADDPRHAVALFGDKYFGVEKLICAMATCSDIRVRKNISILLAKGCRPQIGGNVCKEKLQRLRGLQIMLELQDKLVA